MSQREPVFLQPDQLSKEEVTAFLATLGSRIKQIRKEKGLLMRDLLTRSGYYDAQWRKYEAGGGLTITSLLKVAVALQVTMSDLFDGLGQWPQVSVTAVQQEHGIEPTSDGEPQAELDSEPKALKYSPTTAPAGRKAEKPSAKRSESAASSKRKKSLLQ